MLPPSPPTCVLPTPVARIVQNEQDGKETISKAEDPRTYFRKILCGPLLEDYMHYVAPTGRITGK